MRHDVGKRHMLPEQSGWSLIAHVKTCTCLNLGYIVGLPSSWVDRLLHAADLEGASNSVRMSLGKHFLAISRHCDYCLYGEPIGT